MLKVLNVDDNAAARYVKRRILLAGGYEVIDADSGSGALEALEASKPHVALIDMKLPDMSGFELTRRIRESGDGVHDMPVIQISAVCVTPDDERDGLESGADAFLTMPVDAERLLQVVDNVYQDRRPVRAAQATGALNKNRIRILDAYIRANLHKRVMLGDLAAVVGLSPFHFARAFKAATGESPHSYLVKARLENGMVLLTRTDLSIAEIGKRLGFRTAGHFTARFRKNVGMTPSHYRARHAVDADAAARKPRGKAMPDTAT